MKSLVILAMLALATPAAATPGVQADRFFAVRPAQAGPGEAEFVVRISEQARADVFTLALRAGRPVRLTGRIVQRPAGWNLAWPFYTERHGILPADALVARCSTVPPGVQAQRVLAGAKLHGSAWCPVVRVVREVEP
ncbi:hypothetical protein [Luteibacter yeojuensis]|uniref:BP74 N-terminal domain-containing protein n=1 Tax=Luteibacter yeojuensis TaxID=345309 RepID=A0A0F3KV86_9GAMM|nr:hypothetical protein [Luteibacter yeojuensis]KJV35170.1 hypothetical protein VI08_08800 [Luteibacter yeojuensis]